MHDEDMSVTYSKTCQRCFAQIATQKTICVASTCGLMWVWDVFALRCIDSETVVSEPNVTVHDNEESAANKDCPGLRRHRLPMKVLPDDFA
jgi:hypothetical protein